MRYVELKTSSIKELPGRKMWMLYNSEEHDAKDFSVCYIEIPKKQAALPFHKHDESVEFIYVISGNGHIEVEGKTIPLSSGGAILLDKGENHALFNDDSEDSFCALCTFSPPTMPSNYLENLK